MDGHVSVGRRYGIRELWGLVGGGACIGGPGAAGYDRSGAGSHEVAWRRRGGGVRLAGRPWGAGSAPLGGRHADRAWDTPRVRGT